MPQEGREREKKQTLKKRGKTAALVPSKAQQHQQQKTNMKIHYEE